MDPQEEGTALTPAQQAMSDLWDKHMQSEFESHSVEDTLETMVDDPYVNHVPVLTGGVGLEEVRKFYSERFIPQQPPDTEIIPLSRTVGNDRVVDELICKFTHTIEWIGCCQAFLRREGESRFRLSSSCSSWKGR